MGSTRGKTKQQQKRLNCFNRLEERKQNKTNRKKNEEYHVKAKIV